MKPSKLKEITEKVCHPPLGIFDYNHPDLKWDDGKHGNVTFEVVYIATERLRDFLSGERERGQSDFFTRTSAPKGLKASKAQNDKENESDNIPGDQGPLEQEEVKLAFKRCECGPEDNRDVLPTVQAKKAGSRVKRSEMGLSMKVGCPVYFRHKVLPEAPEITEIRYYVSEHLNHGRGTEGAGLHSTFHRISAELKACVRMKILQGLEPAEIVRQNTDDFITSHMVERGLMDRDEARISLEATDVPRDYYLSYQDVANLKKEVDRQEWRFSENCQQSLQMFAEQNAADILIFKEQEPIVGTADYKHIMRQYTAGSQTVQGVREAALPFYTELGSQPGDSEEGGGPVEPAWTGTEATLHSLESISLDCSGQASSVRSADGSFTFNAENWTLFELAFMKECNVDNAIRFGHGRPLLMDATFGTNREKFPMITLLAVDEHGNGLPIAWSVISQERTEAIAAFLQAVRQRVRKKQPDWEPSCILVDASAAEISAIQQTFPAPVCPFICHWHAQNAWKKQLYQKCNRQGKNSQPNVEPMFRALLEIMRFDPQTDDVATARRLAKEKVDNFLKLFAAEEDFCKYFKAQWADKLDMICQVFRRLKGCNINCTSHAEGYHSSLKANFLHGKRRLTARRLDWLVYILHSRFVESSQVNLHKKEVGRVRNHAAFYRITSLILKAQQMPNERVQLLDGGAAAVPSRNRAGASYSVTGPNSDSPQPSCTCPAAQKDGLCWHIVKVLMLSGATAKALLQYLGLFKGSAMGGYAVLYASMAVAVAADLAAANAAHEQPESACTAGAAGLAVSTVMDSPAPAAEERAALDSCGADGSTQVDQSVRPQAAAGAGTQLRRTRYDRGMSAVSRLASLGNSWDRDSLDWELLEHHALKAVHGVEKALARRGLLAPASSTGRVLPNPSAAQHNSLQRGKSWMETLLESKGRKRKQETQQVEPRPEACAFLPTAWRKEKDSSVLQEIVRKGGGPGSSAAAAPAAGAAAEPVDNPLRVGSSPLAPGAAALDGLRPVAAVIALDAAICSAPPIEDAAGAKSAGSTQRAKRSTRGTAPSRYHS